jgi:hypothetical protein
MAQHDYNIANQGFSSFRSDLNNALSAIQTTNSGTSLPTGAVAGQIWLDTTNATSPTLKFYDGTDSISLATINYTANTVDWLDSSVTITGLSTTATGTVLTLTDTAHTTSVNMILGNNTALRFNELTANGSNYIGLKAPASLSADLTFTLPSTDGTNGQALITNGSGVLSFTTISAGTSWQSVQTTGFTAVSGRGYPCNTTSSAFTVTLPASATTGDYIQIVDYAGTFGTNNITLAPNGLKIEGGTGSKFITSSKIALTLTYTDSTKGWLVTSDAYTNQAIVGASYSAEFLVIAGGGSGGYSSVGASGEYGGGGGGAGGYRNSYLTETSGGGGTSESSITFVGGTTYTITVGAGGAGATTPATTNNGNDSSISGSGFSTITSIGGGKGGGAGTGFSIASTGGSGGGGCTNSTSLVGASGTTNQGYAGGTASPDIPNDLGGGGGGAGAVGVAGSSGGTGGAGLASSITGSSVTRGGGGGGAGNTSGSSGGTGGGGAGGYYPSTSGTAGTANTGGGGGGASGQSNPTSGAGGSGVVILRMATANYSGTTTGSPTVSTSGSDTILVYNASGSYTG